MARRFSDADFADSAPSGPRRFSAADFADATNDAVAAPSAPNYEVGVRTAPASGMPISSPEVGEAPSAYRALLTNEPTQGAMEGGLRSVPSAIGGVAAATGSLALTKNPALAARAYAAGGAGGEGLRQGGVAVNALMGNTAMPTAMDALGRPALAAAEQYAGVKYVPKAGELLKAGASKVGQYIGQNIAGVKSTAYEFAKENLGKVVAHIADTPADADLIAQNIRYTIGNAVNQAKAAYRTTINGFKKNPAYAGKTFDVSPVNKAAVDIADQYGFLPSENAALGQADAVPGEASFMKIVKDLPNMATATIEDIYKLQKRVNLLERTYKGKPVGQAFRELSGKLDDYISNNLGIEEIGNANASWAAAKTLEQETAQLVNANDLIGHVVRTYRNPLKTGAKDTLETIGAKLPGVGDQLLEARAYDAAQSFSPRFRSLPQTGFAAGMGYGAGKAAEAALAGNPFALPLAAAGAVAASPRANLRMLQAGQSIAPYYNRLSQAAEPLLDRAMRYGGAVVLPNAALGASR